MATTSINKKTPASETVLPASTNPLMIRSSKQAIYEMTLPLSGKKISYRPWLVREERILMTAKESGNIEDITAAVLQTVNNCVLDAGINIEQFAMVDVDYIFLKIRAVANGNEVKVPFVCNHKKDGNAEPCGAEFEFILNIDSVNLTKQDTSKLKEVDLTDDMVVMFRYPSFVSLKKIKEDDDDFTQTLKRICAVVDYVAPKKNKDADPIVFDDMTWEHIKEFIESLTLQQFNVINSFIENLPELHVKTEAKCPTCGFVHEGEFKDLINFF